MDTISYVFSMCGHVHTVLYVSPSPYKYIPEKTAALNYMDVSLNGGTPKTPQHDPFLVGKPMFFVGETHHFRKSPYNRCL